jgi:hypothetical protein
MPTTEEFKVKLVSAVDQRSSSAEYAQKAVTFDVTPTISESGAVEYAAIQVIQGPTSFQTYNGTPARTFNLADVKLISRTPSEARDNIQRLNLLRGWRMPYFGQTSLKDDEINSYFSQAVSGGAVKLSPFQRLSASASTLKKRLGAPPEILYFSAYTRSSASHQATTSSQHRGNIHRVPVVLTNLSIMYPNDVSYISTAFRGDIDALGGVPFPTIMTVTIDLTETHAPGEVNKFNLAKYTSGVLDGF